MRRLASLTIMLAVLVTVVPVFAAEDEKYAPVSLEKKLTVPGRNARIAGSLFAPMAVSYSSQDGCVVGELDAEGKVVPKITAPAGSWTTSSPNGRFVAVHTSDPRNPEEKVICTIYEFPGGHKLWSRRGRHAAALVSNDGKTVVLACTNPMLPSLLEFYDGAGEMLKRLDMGVPTEGLTALAPSGRYLVAGVRSGSESAGTLTIYDRTGKRLETLPHENGGVRRLAISPDESRIVVGTSKPIYGGEKVVFSGSLYLLNDKLSIIAQEHGENAVVSDISFSPDGKYFTVSRGGNAELWESKSGKMLWQVPKTRLVKTQADLISIPYVRASSNADRIAVFTGLRIGIEPDPSDRYLLILDKAGAIIGRGNGRPSGRFIEGVEFSADGKRLAVATDSGIEYYSLGTEASGQ